MLRRQRYSAHRCSCPPEWICCYAALMTTSSIVSASGATAVGTSPCE
jgi:hypothetical protein